jgi:ABC-type transporter Mla subunit MlaD
MAMWGLDVEQVRNLSRQLNQQSEQIQQILTTLTGALNGTQWTGPDAEQFRSEWSSTHTASLKQVSAALRDASGKAQRNAAAQEQASSGM